MIGADRQLERTLPEACNTNLPLDDLIYVCNDFRTLLKSVMSLTADVLPQNACQLGPKRAGHDDVNGCSEDVAVSLLRNSDAPTSAYTNTLVSMTIIWDRSYVFQPSTRSDLLGGHRRQILPVLSYLVQDLCTGSISRFKEILRLIPCGTAFFRVRTFRARDHVVGHTGWFRASAIHWSISSAETGGRVSHRCSTRSNTSARDGYRVFRSSLSSCSME